MNNQDQMITRSETDQQLDWTNILFLIISPLIGIVGTGVYVYFNGIHPLEIVTFILFYLLTGLSITAGYHRYFSHRSYDCHFLLRLFYLVFGACALENSLLRWASDHRMHHKNVDTDLDPYNIKKGGWYAHIGWIFYKRTVDPHFTNVQDLIKDPLVLWQKKYYVPIAVLAGFLLPALIGLAVDRPLGGFLFGGFFRVTFVHHATFFINSLAHMVGRQTYSNQDSSRDSWWLAFLTYGEGYHNFHHKFQADYRNGFRWYHFDPTKWLVAIGKWVGLTHRLNRTPSEKILAAKLATDLLHVQKKLHWIPSDIWHGIHTKLKFHQNQLELAHARWSQAKIRYQGIKILKMDQSKKAIFRWKNRLKVYERRFDQAKENWRDVIESLTIQPQNLEKVYISNI